MADGLTLPGAPDVQVHVWLDAGYCIDSVDLDARTVRFRRQDVAQRGHVRR